MSVVALAVLCTAPYALGQTPPNPGTIQRGIENTTPRLPGNAPPAGTATPLAPPRLAIAAQPLGRVKDYAVQGAGDYLKYVRERLDQLVGKAITTVDLTELKGYIAFLYQRQAGRLVIVEARVGGPETARHLVVRIVTPRIEEVRFEQLTSVSPRIATAVRASIQGLVPRGQPLDLIALDTRLRELENSYQVDLPVQLVPASAPGMADAVVTLRPREEKPFSHAGGTVGVNNYQARAYGRVEGDAYGYVNGFTPGSVFSGQASISNGAQYGRIGYNAPLTAIGWNLGVWGSGLVSEAVTVHPAPHGDVFGAGLTMSRVHSFARDVLWQTSIGASAYEARDALLSTELDKRKLVSLSLGQAFFRGQWDDQAYAADLRAGWPVRQSRWNLLLRDTVGHLDLKGNALSYQADQSVNGPHENGVYNKLHVAAGGSWQLVPAWPVALDLSVRGQVAFHNLDVLEQDSIGGITGVRAYAYADPVGDQSAVGSMALRVAPTSDLWLTTYFDEGWVETSYRRYGLPSPIPNSYRLAAAGVTLNWMPWRGAMLSGTFAASIPIETLPVALTPPMETHPDGKRVWVGFTQSLIP